jgi:hypothetical protein
MSKMSDRICGVEGERSETIRVLKNLVDSIDADAVTRPFASLGLHKCLYEARELLGLISTSKEKR